MKKTKLLYIILYTVVFAFPSCKKNADTFGPQITISKPYENQMLYVYDDINVVANVCDDRKLASIDVSIVDETFNTVMTSSTIYPENNCYDVSVSIPIKDIYIATGDYYVMIRASDGTNETRKFQKIHITTLNKKLKYIIVVSKNGGHINISKIDSTYTLTQLKTLTTDYCGSAVSSDAQQFYIAGHYTGDLEVYSTIDWQLQWSIPCIVSLPFPYFDAIAVYNKNLYVSYHGGKFEIYNATGSIRAQRSVDNGYYATLFMPVGDFLITYEQNPAAMTKNLVVYYVPSYVVRQKYVLNYDVQSIQNLNNEKGLLFCNHYNYCSFNVVDIAGQSLTEIATLNTYPFTSVAQLAEGEFLYIGANGVFIYNYPTPSSIAFNYGNHIDHLVYDETSTDYYFAEDFHMVKKFILPYSDLQASVNVPDTIINLLPVYNKD